MTLRVYLQPPDHLLLGDFIGDLLHPWWVGDLAICGSILGVSHALQLVHAKGERERGGQNPHICIELQPDTQPQRIQCLIY